MTTDATPETELRELARTAAWGLVKGGDLDDAASAGKGVLALRLDILDAARRAGITIDLDGDGISPIYTRTDLDAWPTPS